MKELTLKATVENIAAVTEFVEAQLEKRNCPMKTQFQINVAIDEVFANIASYAYAQNIGDVTVRFEAEENPPGVTITFIDSGKPFNPLETEDPDVTLSAQERSVGGLGIFMVKKSMDKLRYRYENGKNIFSMTKRL